MGLERTTDGALVRSLDRGLEILDALIADKVQSLGQIATSADLPKSTAHRLLSTLQARGYVSAAPDGNTYSLGLKGFWLTSARNQIHKQLVKLQKLAGETVNFGMAVGTEVEYLDRVISDHALRWGVEIGSRVPLYCSGMGKAILAFREDLLPDPSTFQKVTSKTITDPVELKAQFEVIRHRGFALDDEEIIDGVLCIAAPVAKENGEVLGAVSIAGPSVRFKKEVAFAQIENLKQCAEQISSILGYTTQEEDA